MESRLPKNPRILSISFSPLDADARVLRQLEVLSELGKVTTVGYGPKPKGVTKHIEVPESAASLPQTPFGVAKLALHMHSSVELNSPGESAVLEQTLSSGPFDLVVANDARAMPLAFAASKGSPVWVDMHEWAPEERATVLVWRLLVGPYFEYLCKKYLPRAAAVTSVSSGLAALYTERFGVKTEVVRNAAGFKDLKPSKVDADSVKLVHSGTADPERNILDLIEATETLGERFSLDLYLLEVPGGHLAEIKNRARLADRVAVHDPVAPADLPRILNQYDLGVFLYPIKTLSHLYSLPNKFFDFVQARLGLVFSPAPETDDQIRKYKLGIVAPGTRAADLVQVLSSITSNEIESFKIAADKAAHALSFEPDREVQTSLVKRLLSKTQ